MSHARRKLEVARMDYATKSDIERVLKAIEAVDVRVTRIDQRIEALPALQNQIKILSAIFGSVGIAALGLLTTYIAKHAF